MYIKHVKQGIKPALAEITARQNGSAIYLSTGINKLDKSLYGGLEPWRIATIAGLSGSGKSTLLEQLKDNLFIDAKKKNIQLKVLDFSFEMLLKDSLLRTLSKRTNKTLEELFNKYTDFTDIINDISNREQYVVDVVITVAEMEQVITDFCSTDSFDVFNIVTIDHTLLTKSAKTDLEKLIIDELFNMLVRLKMKFSSEGTKVSFIVLSQLNREIEKSERITNKALHYPNKNDIFAASSVYYSSDYVWIVHCPSNVTGIGPYYGMAFPKFPLGLPCNLQHNGVSTKCVYVHCIKNRFGISNTIIPFLDELKYSRLVPISLLDDTKFTIE